jgi:predicted Zn-ribbon and HTH transcriptional regulator
MPQPDPKPPKERKETLRQAIIKHLEESPCTTKDLSQLIGIREKEVVPHLEHIQKSLRASGRRLIVQPAQCLSCNYVFKNRKRLSKPSACPQCRNQQIDPPVFSLEARSTPPG